MADGPLKNDKEEEEEEMRVQEGACMCTRMWTVAYLAGERDVRRGDLDDAGVRRHAPPLHRRQALAPRHRLALVRH